MIRVLFFILFVLVILMGILVFIECYGNDLGGLFVSIVMIIFGLTSCRRVIVCERENEFE
jgi:Ni,Fe-hydrogenase I cytochrome b subunit